MAVSQIAVFEIQPDTKFTSLEFSSR